MMTVAFRYTLLIDRKSESPTKSTDILELLHGANVKDSQCQEELIDYGFATLRMLNNMVSGRPAQSYESHPPVYLLEE